MLVQWYAAESVCWCNCMFAACVSVFCAHRHRLWVFVYVRGFVVDFVCLCVGAWWCVFFRMYVVYVCACFSDFVCLCVFFRLCVFVSVSASVRVFAFLCICGFVPAFPFVLVSLLCFTSR